MKKVSSTSTINKINKDIIVPRVTAIMVDCLLGMYGASLDNDFNKYKEYYSYFKDTSAFFNSDYILSLLSDDEKEDIRGILAEANNISDIFSFNKKFRSIFKKSYFKPILIKRLENAK